MPTGAELRALWRGRKARVLTDERRLLTPAPLLEIESSPILPDSAEVVIIGGGVVGAFAAYYLARRGVNVAWSKRDGSAPSSRAGTGAGAEQNCDARELPMATRSLDLWE